MNKSERLRSIVAQGWTMMFIVFLANLTIEVVRSMLTNDSLKWAEHIGTYGLRVILAVMVTYALMPMLVRAVSARWFRPAVVAITALMTLFVGAHEISHLAPLDKPFGFLHALDIAHHVLGISVIAAAVMWARQED